MITTAIVFDHRGRTKKNEEGPLEVRVTVNRKPYYIGTGVRVRRKQWAFETIVDHPQSNVLNERLGILLQRIMQIVNSTLASGEQLDVAKIRREAWNAMEERRFVDWIADEIALLRVKSGTMKHYNSLVRRLREYGKLQSWGDVTVDGIYRWDAWLRSLPGRTEAITGGGVYNYHKCLRALLNRAERRGMIAGNPYHLMRGEFSKGDRENTEYLTEEEMDKILSFSPAPGSAMAKARDLFIFQMFTGLSWSDSQAFDISQYKEIDGKWRMVGKRIKTGQPFVNQLLPPAVEVLQRYGMCVPKIQNQPYNRMLKEVGVAAGITYPLHSHLARHTFATYMLRNGVKIENLAKMLGHANIKQTQRYAKVLAESVHEDFDRIADLIQKKGGTH